MRRFLISLNTYAGEAEAIYDQTGKLIKFDVSNTDMSMQDVDHFKYILPAHVADLKKSFAAINATIVEADFDISLDDFKREYPYSRNYHLLDAIWSKMRKTEQVVSYYACIEYRKYCERNKIKPPFIKIAASWLNNREYLNDWKKM